MGSNNNQFTLEDVMDTIIRKDSTNKYYFYFFSWGFFFYPGYFYFKNSIKFLFNELTIPSYIGAV